eukprot:COSAG01_NODE_3795_length_5688_cov_11.154410_1_plen_44_part_00
MGACGRAAAARGGRIAVAAARLLYTRDIAARRGGYIVALYTAP